MSIKKSEIKLNANGKSLNAYLAESGNDSPGVLVLPSWWGLKPFFKQICDQFAEQGYTALAPDYYNGRVGVTIEETKELQQEAEGDFDAMAALIKAAKDHLLSLQPDKPIGIVGFSMGTDWAILTAAKEPNISAIVLFYGGWSTDFSKMKSKMLGHYAEMDEWVPLEQIKEMEQNMKAAGVDVTIHLYPKTAHWFMETDRPEYDSESAKLAWDRTFDFLKKNL
jgi:carboxymethylenebutenolidase